MKKGKVYLVGAGPGDYGLLTLKGLKCIQKADVIVYDRLANEAYLKEAQPHCKFIYVGKVSSNHTMTQDEINEVLVQEALKGKVVTRLKGGDPYVFGRGGEEGEYLLSYDISFEVVPGITSAIGGLCYAGIPITHRDYTSSFHVVTGHLKDDEHTSINWQALAHMGGTIVFLMGVSNLDKICRNLMSEGMHATTSVAVINWATRPNQRVVTGDLTTICDVVKREKITSPSLIVVGEVVKLREKLNFFETRPLFGKTIVTTRARAQSSGMVEALSELGATVIEAPTIKIEPLEDQSILDTAIEGIKQYTYLVFTSQNAVTVFFEALYAKNLDARQLQHMKIAVIGESTKAMLKNYGICADIMPTRFVAEGLVEVLAQQLTAQDHVLIPTAKTTRDLLQVNLSAICKVDTVSVYENRIDDSSREEVVQALMNKTIDYITFTSASTVKNLITLIGQENVGQLQDVKLVSIGEITTQTMTDLGLTVYKQAHTPSVDEMVEMLVDDQQDKRK